GAGKSILFILPASYSTGVIVVVIPLISLRDNLKNRYDKAGIKCALVILVTPELAVSKGFRDFINRQQAIGRLD
ncbi:uncharacterized protein K441DRAFT_590208, partial [Cenococcum geophilum 1.58]